MNNTKPHRNLMAWQKSMDFAVRIYELTRRFPKKELYALTSQLRRGSRPDATAILSNAIGSFNEIDTQLEWRYVLVMSQGVNLIARSKRLMSALHLRTDKKNRLAASIKL